MVTTTLWVIASSTPGFGETATREGPKPDAVDPSLTSFTGVVLEKIDSSRYTYILVDTGTSKVWVASTRFAVNEGDRVSVPNGIGMSNFHSPTLNRTFDMVYFASQVTTPGSDGQAGELPEGHPPIDAHGAPLPAPDLDLSGIEQPEGGMSVAEIHARKADLAGKEVTVRGKVVKATDAIMGRNWVHLRDGTGGEGANDLTVTTQASLAVGDTVTVSGVVALDKDFGFGYRYDVILEEAGVVEK
jgi:hypothetical protein